MEYKKGMILRHKIDRDFFLVIIKHPEDIILESPDKIMSCYHWVPEGRWEGYKSASELTYEWRLVSDTLADVLG